MSTNEPPVDPSTAPGEWRPPAEPSGEPVGAEALADADASADKNSSSDEPVTGPPAWQPPNFDPTAPPAYPPGGMVDPLAAGVSGGDMPPPPPPSPPPPPPPPLGGSFLPGADFGDTTGASSLGDAGAGYVPSAESSGDSAPAGYPAGGAGTGNDGSGWAPGSPAAGGITAGAAAAGMGTGAGQAYPGGPPPPPPPPPSYPYSPVQPASPPPRKRPGVVTAAAAILLTLAVCGLGQSVLSLASMGTTVDRFKDRARFIGASRSDIDAAVSQMRASYIGGMFVTILIAVMLAGLAYGLFKGSNGARIATWVVSGIAILCDCCSSVIYFGISGFDITTSGTNDLQIQLTQAQMDAFPDWFLATVGGISLMQLLGYIATAVLLALPAANAFFKKVAPGWPPPTP